MRRGEKGWSRFTCTMSSANVLRTSSLTLCTTACTQTVVKAKGLDLQQNAFRSIWQFDSIPTLDQRGLQNQHCSGNVADAVHTKMLNLQILYQLSPRLLFEGRLVLGAGSAPCYSVKCSMAIIGGVAWDSGQKWKLTSVLTNVDKLWMPQDFRISLQGLVRTRLPWNLCKILHTICLSWQVHPWNGKGKRSICMADQTLKICQCLLLAIRKSKFCRV